MKANIFSRKQEAGHEIDDRLRELTIGEKGGIFLFSNTPSDIPNITGLATAARISAYLEQSVLKPRISAVNIDAAKCRGCGDCVSICPYIEIFRSNGLQYASVDKALCLGCGACVAVCAAGAITQPGESDTQLIATLSSMLC